MRDAALDRRRFLVAAIAFSGLGTGVLGPSLRLGRAWAQGSAQLDAGTLDAMAHMARRLYPHDAISDSVYAQVLDEVLASTAADGSLAESLRQAEVALDAQRDAGFVTLNEEEQLAAMRAIEGRDFFVAIQTAVRSGLYDHPVVWEHLGYGGPSFAQGGYLNRGAGEVDWLPETE